MTELRVICINSRQVEEADWAEGDLHNSRQVEEADWAEGDLHNSRWVEEADLPAMRSHPDWSGIVMEGQNTRINDW